MAGRRELRDAIRNFAASLRASSAGFGGKQIPRGYDPGVLVVRNDSDDPQSTFAVLGIDGPATSIVNGDAAEDFLNFPLLSCVAPESPEHLSRFVVLLEPLAVGASGPAVVSGVVPALVYVRSVSDEFCDIISPQDDCYLGTGSSSGARILWLDDDAVPETTAWALISLPCVQATREFWARLNHGTNTPTVIGGNCPWQCKYPWVEVEPTAAPTGSTSSPSAFGIVSGGRTSTPTTFAYHTLEEYGNSLPVTRRDVIVRMHEEPALTPTGPPRYWFDQPCIENGFATLTYSSGIGPWVYGATPYTSCPYSAAHLQMSTTAAPSTGPSITVYNPTAPRSKTGSTYNYLRLPIGYQDEIVHIKLARDIQAGEGSTYGGGIVLDELQFGPWRGELTDDLPKGTSAPCNVANEMDNPANSRAVEVFDVLMTGVDDFIPSGATVLVDYIRDKGRLCVIAANCPAPPAA